MTKKSEKRVSIDFNFIFDLFYYELLILAIFKNEKKLSCLIIIQLFQEWKD